MPAVDINASRRTFQQYKLDVLHALGLEEGDATGNLDVGAIVNDALEHLAAMHSWTWLSSNQKSLDIVGGVDHILLPEDFGTLTALEHTEGFTRLMIPTTWVDLLRLRQQSIQEWSRSYWYVIQIGNVAVGDEDAGLDLPTIELYPTPADDFTDAISIVYRRFLRRMVDDADRPQWPSYMDRPCSLLARAFALGDFDAEQLPRTAEGEQFQLMLPDVKTKDGLARRSYGVMDGGLYPRTVPISPFYPRQIPNPTQV